MSSVPSPIKSVAVTFSTTSSLEPHPFIGQIHGGMSPTASTSSLHAKRVADIDAMILQELHTKKENDVYYLISTSWWNRWRNFKGHFTEANFESEIDNWSLVHPEERTERERYEYSTCKFHLMESLIQDTDFVCVSTSVWTAMHSWYGGGPPLPRLLVADPRKVLELELYPALPMSMIDAKRIADDTSLATNKFIQDCFCCGKIAKDRCMRCSAVYYCSRECQKAHWKYHSRWCMEVAKNKENAPQLIQTLTNKDRRGKMGLVR